MELEFPKEIIQHIQSFLDGDDFFDADEEFFYQQEEDAAARTRLVSKSWYNAWSTRPILVFKDRSGNEEILKSACETMKRYMKLNLKLEKLVLMLCFTSDPDLVNQLISAASTLGVAELGLIAYEFSYPSFDVQVLDIASLTKLSITRIRINHPGRGRVLCSRLVSLRLDGCEVKDVVIRDILVSCPLIQKLALFNLYDHDSYESNDDSYESNDESSTNDVRLCPRLISLQVDGTVEPDTLLRDILLGSPLVQNLDFGSQNIDSLLPSHVFTVRSLTRLSVSFGRIQSVDDRLLFSHLLSLCLDHVSIGDGAIGDILLSCPLIENLEFKDCTAMSNVNMSEMHNLVALRIKSWDAYYNCHIAKVSFGSIN